MKKLDNQDVADLTVRWTRVQPIVAGYISAMVPDFGDAEDVLQRVALVIVKKYSQYDKAGPFLGWAMGIARYEILAYRRRKAKDRHLLDPDLIGEVADAYQQVSGHLGPMRQALAECLEKVGGRHRRLIEMWYVDRRDPGEIMKLLGIAQSTVYVLLHRARLVLRRCVERRMKLEGQS